MKTIVIQGSMEEEICVLKEFFTPTEEIVIGGYTFYLARYKNMKIIISNTQCGIINATTATTIAILKFCPDIIINQGCAGAHKIDLNIGDIIIGKSAVYINDFKQPAKLENEGSNSLTWIPNRKRSYNILATNQLLQIASETKFDKNLIMGVLGSGDLFSKEHDRIKFLQQTFNTYCEDMESVAVYKVCESFNVQKIGFRVISNNELTGIPFDKSISNVSQNFTIKFINKIIDLNI